MNTSDQTCGFVAQVQEPVRVGPGRLDQGLHRGVVDHVLRPAWLLGGDAIVEKGADVGVRVLLQGLVRQPLFGPSASLVRFHFEPERAHLVLVLLVGLGLEATQRSCDLLQDGRLHLPGPPDDQPPEVADDAPVVFPSRADGEPPPDARGEHHEHADSAKVEGRLHSVNNVFHPGSDSVREPARVESCHGMPFTRMEDGLGGLPLRRRRCGSMRRLGGRLEAHPRESLHERALPLAVRAEDIEEPGQSRQPSVGVLLDRLNRVPGELGTVVGLVVARNFRDPIDHVCRIENRGRCRAGQNGRQRTCRIVTPPFSTRPQPTQSGRTCEVLHPVEKLLSTDLRKRTTVRATPGNPLSGGVLRLRKHGLCRSAGRRRVPVLDQRFRALTVIELVPLRLTAIADPVDEVRPGFRRATEHPGRREEERSQAFRLRDIEVHVHEAGGAQKDSDI